MGSAVSTNNALYTSTTAGPVAPEERARPGHIVRLFHLTDLHVRLQSNAEQTHDIASVLSAAAQRLATNPTEHLTWLAERIMGKWLAASPSALDQLQKELLKRCADDIGESPVVVAQTGDVEAFGRDRTGRWRGFEELHSTLWADLEALGVTAIDVYGNHDLWLSNPFQFGFRSAHANGPDELAAACGHIAGPYEPASINGNEDAVVLYIHRLNTVEPGIARGAIRAQGTIGPEPTGAHNEARDPIERLKSDTGTKGVHLVLSHHPVHDVPDLLDKGDVKGSDVLLDELDADVIFLSGHMHELHPEYPQRAPRQLISPSPTVGEGGLDVKSRQLVAYDFAYHDDRVWVTRYRYPHASREGYNEAEGPEELTRG